ncbi:MAG: glycosyltransferase family 4 protein [Cyanobacteria bacterium P01_H01_bin.121]
MKVLIYAYNYHPEPIGIAPLITELAEGLVAIGHQVRVITAMPNYPQREIYPEYRGKLYSSEERNGVVIQRSYVWVRPNPKLLDRVLLDGSFVITSLMQALRGWRPDIILYTTPPLPVSVPVALLGWLYRCPTVLNLQDILPEAAVHVGLLSNPVLIRVFATLEWFAYRTSNAIAVIADKFTDNLVGKDVDSAKIRCIANWVNVDFICPRPKLESQFCQTHKLQEKFVVLYSGNIALTQGLETVIDTAVELKTQPDIQFVIVGEAKALQKLQTYCEQHQVENVLLLPFQPRAALPDMLAAADVGLVVQRRNVISFNLPSKIQVLLACGRPIIASVPQDGAAAQTIANSGGGLVVNPEDPKALATAILQLHGDRQKAETLGQAGRDFALQRFSFERSLQAYEQLFKDLKN